MSDAAFWPLALGALGAIVGSFLATLVIRWLDGRSVGGRSACDGCGRQLRVVELVPLASRWMLRGRCRTCGAAIDSRHWQIETMAVLIGAAAGLATATPLAVAGAVFGWLLLTLAALDVAALWLPDRLTGMLALAGLVAGLPSLPDRLIGGAAGFASLWLIAAGYRHWRGRSGMGGGDPKLLGAVGLWLGWRMLPAVVLAAALVGLGLVALAMMHGRAMRRDQPVPFGALIAVAAYPAWLAVVALCA